MSAGQTTRRVPWRRVPLVSFAASFIAVVAISATAEPSVVIEPTIACMYWYAPWRCWW